MKSEATISWSTVSDDEYDDEYSSTDVLKFKLKYARDTQNAGI